MRGFCKCSVAFCNFLCTVAKLRSNFSMWENEWISCIFCQQWFDNSSLWSVATIEIYISQWLRPAAICSDADANQSLCCNLQPSRGLVAAWPNLGITTERGGYDRRHGETVATYMPEITTDLTLGCQSITTATDLALGCQSVGSNRENRSKMPPGGEPFKVEQWYFQNKVE